MVEAKFCLNLMNICQSRMYTVLSVQYLTAELEPYIAKFFRIGLILFYLKL